MRPDTGVLALVLRRCSGHRRLATGRRISLGGQGRQGAEDRQWFAFRPPPTRIGHTVSGAGCVGSGDVNRECSAGFRFGQRGAAGELRPRHLRGARGGRRHGARVSGRRFRLGRSGCADGIRRLRGRQPGGDRDGRQTIQRGERAACIAYVQSGPCGLRPARLQ